MDYPVTEAVSPDELPVVVWANHFQFGRGEVITNREVESRCLIWGEIGSGSIETAGRSIRLTPNTCVFLPWRHSITYRAAMDDPFMVSAIHIIPWHHPSVPIEPHAAHGPTDPLAGSPYRRDVDGADLRGLGIYSVEPRDRLLTAARLTVSHFQHGNPDAASLRALAVVVLNELRTARAHPLSAGYDAPATLVRMQEYAASHLRNSLTVAQIAAAGVVSESSAERLFRRHTGKSVGRWLNDRRMSIAGELLRTTNASVREVAEAVGFDDASYFSRVFRRSFGSPPGRYGARSRLC